MHIIILCSFILSAADTGDSAFKTIFKPAKDDGETLRDRPRVSTGSLYIIKSRLTAA